MPQRTRTQYFALGGGLDLVTPALSTPTGHCLAMANFEPWINGGYRRVLGYERFDGRPSPSAATFTGFDLTDATGLTTGTTVTGDTSGATGVVIGISGNSIGVTKVSGTFVNGEGLNTGAYTINSVPGLKLAPTQALMQAWLLASENEYRGDIAAVPGSGSILGVWRHQATTYAFRANAGGTAVDVYKASTSGWTQVTLSSYTLRFDAGMTQINVGDTLTGAVSSASGTVHRVVLHAGSFSGNDAVGYVVLTGVTGGPYQDNEALQVSAATVATADGASSQVSFATGGRFEFISHNFAGGSSTYYVYGCDGVNPAFEIDDSDVFSPILMPSTVSGAPASNAPFLIEAHRNYLWLAFPGGSVQVSVIGEPLQYNAFLGAGEFGLGDEVNAIKSVPGGVLVMQTRRQTYGMFGTTTSDFELRLLADSAGAYRYTANQIGTLYSLDDRGIADVNRTEAFGDFVSGTVSQLVQPLIDTFKATAVASTVIRTTEQYRLYFADGTFLIMYAPPGKKPQFGYAEYPDAVEVIYNAEDENGAEVIFFGGSDGFVYQDQKGKNYDGDTIPAYIRLPFNHLKSPSYRKRFRRADLELSAEAQLSLQFTADLTYGAPDVSSSVTALTTNDVDEIDIFGGGGFWDSSNFDEFYWDAQSISTARAELTGTGTNIGFLIFSDSAVDAAFILQGVTLHYEMRRLQR